MTEISLVNIFKIQLYESFYLNLVLSISNLLEGSEKLVVVESSCDAKIIKLIGVNLKLMKNILVVISGVTEGVGYVEGSSEGISDSDVV